MASNNKQITLLEMIEECEKEERDSKREREQDMENEVNNI